MVEFRAAHAGEADWNAAAEACLAQLDDIAGASLGFVYATDHLAGRMSEIVDWLGKRTGLTDWIGTAGIGIAANAGGAAAEYYDRPALAVMVASLPRDAYRVFEPVRGDLGPLEERHRDWLGQSKPALGVVHADPRNPRLATLLTQLSARTGAYLVGGLSSSRAGFPQVATRVAEGGVSGAFFAGSVAVATGLTQGCSPVGPAREVTEVEGNIVKALDGRPALDCFKEDVAGFLADRGQGKVGSLHVALPVPGSDTGDYLVRNLIGLDRERGWIAIGAEPAAGERLLFARRDRAGAEKDLGRMLDGLARRLPVSAGEQRIKGGLYFSCVSRGRNLFGTNSEELRQIADALGEFPLVGFFANGEICRDQLYGHTGVLTLFL